MRELGLGIDARRQLQEVTNDFRGHDFTRLDLRFGPHFPPQSLLLVYLGQAEPIRLVFVNSGLNLEGADLSNANLQGANLQGANLRNVKLVNARMRETNIAGVRRTSLFPHPFWSWHLVAASRGRLTRSWCGLWQADLSGADLSGVRLHGVKGMLQAKGGFKGGDLSGLTLTKLDLKGFDLSRTNLCKATLSGADLTDANLTVSPFGPLTLRLRLCLLYTSPSPRDATLSRMPSSA